jgi:hypothetical protein
VLAVIDDIGAGRGVPAANTCAGAAPASEEEKREKERQTVREHPAGSSRGEKRGPSWGTVAREAKSWLQRSRQVRS